EGGRGLSFIWPKKSGGDDRGTERSGIYRFQVAGLERQYLAAVNVPTTVPEQTLSESDLTRLTADEVKQHFPDVQLHTDPSQVDLSKRPKPEESPDKKPDEQPTGTGAKVARVLLILLLVLLVLELILAWQFGHYSADAGTLASPPKTGPVLPAIVGIGGLFLLGFLVAVAVHYQQTEEFLGFLPAKGRTLIERSQGLEEAPAGEENKWKLADNSSLFPGDLDPWLKPAVGLAAALLILIIYLQEGRIAGTGYKLL